MLWRNAPLTRCATELALGAHRNRQANGSDHRFADNKHWLFGGFWYPLTAAHRLQIGTIYDAVYIVVGHADLRAAYRELGYDRTHDGDWFDGPNDLFAKHRECRELFEAELGRVDNSHG